MAVINYEEKWMYFMEPHTASRAVQDALIHQPNCHAIEPHHVTLERMTCERRGTVTKESVLGFDAVSTVRNPLNVAITLWSIGPGKHNPFRDWVLGSQGQSYLDSPLGGFWKTSNIICWYEYLKEDLEYTFQRQITLRRDKKHKTPNKQLWWSYYQDADVFEFLTDYYRDFIEEFGYEYHHEGGEIKVTVNEDARRKRRRRIGYGRYTICPSGGI